MNHQRLCLLYTMVGMLELTIRGKAPGVREYTLNVPPKQAIHADESIEPGKLPHHGYSKFTLWK